MMTTCSDIENAEHRVESLKSEYLKRWGWKSTCATPGSYWLWKRDFKAEDRKAQRRWRRRKPGPLGKPSAPTPYGIITANTELAVSMTVAFLDEQPERWSDDN